MTDVRHQKRAQLMQALYAADFQNQSWVDQDFDFSEETLKKTAEIVKSQEEYDQLIVKYAPERSIKEMSRIDLAILRLIIHENKHKDTPPKVLINEAVELAKEFGSESAFGFVNAVLEKILLRGKKENGEKKTEKNDQSNQLPETDEKQKEVKND